MITFFIEFRSHRSFVFVFLWWLVVFSSKLELERTQASTPNDVFVDTTLKKRHGSQRGKCMSLVFEFRF
jgi:hypothetical protein